MTPGFALSFLRNSLMTSVSTRYTPRLGCILDTGEVLVLPDFRNRRQRFCQRPFSRPAQHDCQDFPMLCFGTAPVLCCSLLQRLHQGVVDPAHDQVCHDALAFFYTLSMIARPASVDASPEARISMRRITGIAFA